MGETPEEIATDFGHLSLAQVHAALAYYYANKAEIDADLELKNVSTMCSRTSTGTEPGEPDPDLF